MEFPLEEKYDFKGFFLLNFRIQKDIITIILINLKMYFNKGEKL